MWWPAVVKSEWELRLDYILPIRLDYGRSPHAYVNQRLQIQLELLMMSGVPIETCWAFNERSNNKFYYKVASCWLFLRKDKLYRLIYYSKSALHVSGNIFAHHQKHLAVFTVSGIVHPSCCRLVSWMNWKSFSSSKTPAGSSLGEQYQIL
jgi:hypothetical protein